MKVEVIKSEYASRCRTAGRQTYSYIASELIGQRPSFAGDEGNKVGIYDITAKIDVPDTGESKCYGGLSRKVSTLSTAVEKIADIHIAHAQAAKDQGDGRKGASTNCHCTRKRITRR